MNRGETQAAGGPHNSGDLQNSSGPNNPGDQYDQHAPQNTKLLGIALEAALEAGAEILDVYKSEDFDVRHKADNSPLTLADRRAHETIKKGLEGTGIPLLSEEGADIPYTERKKWSSYWLVDPLDGTKEFIKRNGEFTVNIALMTAEPGLEEGSAKTFFPSAGVVYVPVKDIAYIGFQGKGGRKGTPNGARKEARKEASKEPQKGAWKVEQASKLLDTLGSLAGRSTLDSWRTLSSRSSLGSTSSPDTSGIQSSLQRDLFSLLESAGNRLPVMDPCSRTFSAVVSRSHNSPETEKLMDTLEAEYGPAERVSSGSSIKLCLVAEGTADVYPRFAPTMEWDTAAGDAVCRAAGCRVTGQDRTTPLTYNKEDLHNPWFVVLGPRML